MKITLKSILITAGILLLVSVVFFIYTTSSSSATKYNLFTPKEETTDLDESLPGFTIILLKNDRAFVYDDEKLQEGKSLVISEIGSLLAERKNRSLLDSFRILIKPTNESSYKNTVDVLDEMVINGVKNYKMLDVNKAEKEFLKIKS